MKIGKVARTRIFNPVYGAQESIPFYSIEDGSVRFGYSRNPTQCVNVLVLRFVAGLLWPRLFFKQVEQSSK
jgi:hypothetical protein